MTEPTIHERTQELISEAHDDPRAVRASEMKKARAHLSRCPQCRAFEAALAESGPAIGGARPEEHASTALVAGVLAAVEVERARPPVLESVAPAGLGDAAEAAHDVIDTASPDATSPVAPVAPPAGLATAPEAEAPEGVGTHRSPMPAWSRWAWGAAAAAAVLALFLGVRVAVGPGGLGSGTPAGLSNSAVGTTPESAASQAPQATASGAAKSAGTFGGGPGSAVPTGSHGAAPTPRAGTASPSAAPGGPAFGRVPALVLPDLDDRQPSGYVPAVVQLTESPVFLTFGSPDVWRFDGWLRNVPSTSLVKVGEVDARLGAGRQQHRDVYEPIGHSDIRYVHWDDSDYQVYVATVARLGDHVYVLQSASPIGDWGRWPQWPTSVMPYPYGPKAFAAQIQLPGQGAVYVAPTVRAIRGLAVPPREKAGAVRLPGWSWWRARRTQ